MEISGGDTASQRGNLLVPYPLNKSLNKCHWHLLKCNYGKHRNSHLCQTVREQFGSYIFAESSLYSSIQRTFGAIQTS